MIFNALIKLQASIQQSRRGAENLLRCKHQNKITSLVKKEVFTQQLQKLVQPISKRISLEEVFSQDTI